MSNNKFGRLPCILFSFLAFALGILTILFIDSYQSKLSNFYMPKVIDCRSTTIPRAAYMTILYLQKHNGKAPRSFRPVTTFRNSNPVVFKHLPKKIYESDIYPQIKGVNRGRRRLVFNQDVFYYTRDHYRHFVRVTAQCIRDFKNGARSI